MWCIPYTCWQRIYNIKLGNNSKTFNKAALKDDMSAHVHGLKSRDCSTRRLRTLKTSCFDFKKLLVRATMMTRMRTTMTDTTTITAVSGLDCKY